jgi:hypothetical protein
MRWPPDSTTRRKELEKNFQANLKSIAECSAIHEGSDSVSTAHLNNAYQTLSRLGLSRRRFTERAESQTALGAFLIGAALSCPTAVQVLIPVAYCRPVSISLLIVCFLVGTFFLIRGWYLGKFPPVPTEKRTVIAWFWTIAVWVLFGGSVIIVGNSIYQHFEGNSCGGPDASSDEPPAAPAIPETQSILKPSEPIAYPTIPSSTPK